MKTIRHLERARFAVPASSGEKEYIVNMEQHFPNGACTCKDFTSRRLSQWQRFGDIVNHGQPGATRCKHMAAVIATLSPKTRRLFQA